MRISDWSSDVCSSDLTWGVSLILQQAARDLFGATGVSVTAPAWLDGAVTLGSQSLPMTRLFIMLVAIAVLGGLALFLRFTRAGLLVRAVKDRKSVVSGKSVSVRVDLGGRRFIKKKKQKGESKSRRCRSNSPYERST